MSNKVTKIKKTIEIDTAPFVNENTGEQFNSEIKGLELEFKEDSNLVNITSDNYVVIDSNAFNYLKKHLNRTELGSFTLMTSDLKTTYNIVYNNTIPHSNESLQNFLGISSKSTFTLLIRQLIKIGVLYQMKGNIRGQVRVIYIMNPFIARKRKTLDNSLINIFKDFKL